jgi:hypothetical protein
VTATPAHGFAGGVYTKGSGQGLVHTTQADLSALREVRVDGTVLASSAYTTQSGSTVVTLLPAYLDTLTVGQHTLTVVFAGLPSVGDGFEVRAAANPTTATPTSATPTTATPTPTPTTTRTPTPSASTVPLPNTGGDGWRLWPSVTMIGAGMMLLVLARTRRYQPARAR